MLTLALYGLLAILLIGAIYLAAAWLLPAGEQIAPPVRDEPIWSLPAERALVAADVADVRLPVALRGYRFAETDLLLDRLVEELRARDEEIARLRQPVTAPTPAKPDTGKPDANGEPSATPSPAAKWAPAATTSPAAPGADAVTAAAAKSKAEAAAAKPKPAPANDMAPAAEPKSDAGDDAKPAAQPGRHDD